VNPSIEESKPTAFGWWAGQRVRYNLIMLAAAPVSFIGLLIVWWLFEARLPCLEVTGFSLVFGGILFLLSLGVANLCYFLGPISECIVRPNDAMRFRRVVFALGTGFSLLLIFFPVLGNLVAAVVGPAPGGHCN